MEDLAFLKHFINRQVKFGFDGRNLKFNLSQSLFSGHDVDDGTELLLKTIAKSVDVEQLDNVLDLGCGVGVLGICLKKRNPALTVTCQDRDALALAFTKMNAQLNEIDAVDIRAGLGLQNVEGQRFDLILSNLPGKAGEPVLTEIVRRMPSHLTESGRAAVVVVKPLAEPIERTIVENGSELIHVEGRSGYTVFHFREGNADPLSGDEFPSYLRGIFPFQVGNLRLELQTVYNIPEFDTLSFQTRLAISTLKNRKFHGRVLCWNPGQGHVPALLAVTSGDKITDLVIASRDLLSLEICKRNLATLGTANGMVTASHLPHFKAVSGRFDFIMLFPDVDPGVPWDRVLLSECNDLLSPQGRALVTAKSTFMHRMLSNNPGLRIEAQKRRHGLRSILFAKPS